MQIELTPEQYQKLMSKLVEAKDVVLDFSSGPDRGMISTPQVTLSAVYDGSQWLSIEIIAKHGLARFASDNDINSHNLQLVKENEA